MWVQDPEQCVGELRELIVQPVVNACGKKGHAFQQPRDVRIVDGICGEAKPPGDLGVRGGKLRGKAAKRIELAVVVG